MSNVSFPRKQATELADLTVSIDDALEQLATLLASLRLYMLGGLDPDGMHGFVLEGVRDLDTNQPACRHATPVGDYCRWCAESPEG